MRKRLLVAVGVALALAGAALGAQWRVRIEPNVPYDGRFTFVRLRYQVYRRSGWEFDYPAMERNLMKITDELTTINPHITGSNIHNLDDPELLRFPIAYLSEPGGWIPNDAEAAGLRAYLAKGGFLIVDDFMRREWDTFERAMHKVIPGAQFVRLDPSHPIYDTFFQIKSLKMGHPQDSDLTAEFYGIYEDNDPTKRLMVVIDYNTDIGDFMEWSGQGWFPVDVSNDAYKIAIDYLVYGMTR